MAVGDYISEIQTSDRNTHPIGSSFWVSSETWNGKTNTEVENEIKAKFSNLTEITWKPLKDKRDTNSLIPGMQYRITDYTCTTTQSNTKSAGHVFDIIVTADSKNKLNEEARAINHKFDNPNDDYFKDCDLSAWKIWYCLDNDTERFDWVDGTNGKGVIYRMIDEFNNDIPYDFKNIQFKRYKITSSVQGDLVGKYATPDAVDVTVDDSTPYWCYTFSTDSLEDVSLDGYSNLVYNNIIPKFHYGLSLLNNIVFIGKGNLGNRFGVLCSDSTFGNNCYGNIFGNNCSRNTFGGDCYYNIFGNSCSGNTFGNNLEDNTFGNYCNSNTFGDACKSNTFGNDCRSITFGDNCSYNTFGTDCSSNTFGAYLVESQFGDGVQYFGITTQRMTTKPTAANAKNYIRWLIVENGVRYVNVYVTGSTSSSSQCQNVRICLGIQGVDNSNRKTFDITSCINSKLNNVYQPANSKTTSV